jgi:D-beta-D-heptose 7-phosphate kinase/D-beta-D-heptose 1-phosphate adenosyltransferase
MWFQDADFSKIRVLVVGDLMLDQYWDGSTARISPEAPVPVVNVTDIHNRLGGAGNVANNLAALGATVTLLAYLGQDESADVVLQLLKARQINHHILRLDGYPTIKKLRILSRNQQLIRLDTEKTFTKIDQAKLLDYFSQTINTSEVVVLSDYAKGTIQDPQAFIQIAKKKNVPVIVDPKRDFAAYRNASVVTPNFKELQDVVGACHTERDIVKKGRALMKANNFEALIITRGSDGMTVIPGDAPDIHLPACSGEVYDVTGAGDTVVAAIAVALAKKVKTIDAARFANLAASIVVGKVGTSTVSLSELQKTAFQAAYPFPVGVIPEAELCSIIKIAQSRGERIVFTNGCYDIIHYGHIRYLEQAKSFGDRLIVGVNDDHSVARLKGEARPINPLEQRMAVLAGLKAVDWVVPFTESTPGRLVEALSPDIIVKTDEYFKTIEDIPTTEGVQHVLSKGGKVYLIPRTPNVSSTNIAIMDGQLE